MDTQELIAGMLRKQSDFGYYGSLDLDVWGFSPFSHHRDSEILDESNWAVISEDMTSRFPDSTAIECFNHWAVGWVENLLVDTTNAECVEAVAEWMAALENYPVANDEDFSRREYESYCEAYDCWARFDISRHCEQDGVEAFLDDDGWFEPTDEQEEFLRGWVIDQLFDSGGNHIRLAELESDHDTWMASEQRRKEREAGQLEFVL